MDNGSDGKLYFIVSIPNDFKDKFYNALSNLNAINTDHDNIPPVKIEGIYIRKFSAVPKINEEG